MQIIEAALAFAITMLVLSILCSTLVETIHRLLGMREAGFRKMIGELFDHVLAPYAGADPQAKEEFQARMTALRSPVGLSSSQKTAGLPAGFWLSVWDRVATLWRGRGLAEQTTMGFMERLGTDPVGEALVRTIRAAVPGVGGVAPAAAVIDQAVNVALQDVAQKFAAFGEEATTFFERRARLISVCVAMVVAFALHVDAINLFKSLATNSSAREAILAMQDEALKSNKRIQDQIEAANKAAANLQGAAPVNTPPAGTPPANLQELTKAAKDAQDEMQKTLSKLQDTGVSIGWSEKRLNELAWKWTRDSCVDVSNKPAQLINGKCDNPNKLQSVVLFGLPATLDLWVGLLLGGLLIGLGGPFWSQTIANLTRIRDVTREATAVATTVQTVRAPGGPAGQQPTPQPRTPVDVFRVANGMH